MKFLRDQKGFSLIEILVSLAISGMIMAGLTGAIFQTVRVTERSRPQIVALDDIRNVSRVITDDLRKTEGTDLVDGADPVSSVDLYWTDWTETQPYRHECTIALVGNVVTRTRDAWEDTDLDWVEDGSETDITISEILTIGTYISDLEFSLDGDIIIVTITSSPQDLEETEHSKTYRITLSGMEDPVR